MTDRRILELREWNVLIHGRSEGLRLRRWDMRFFMVSAALLVKVTARILEGLRSNFWRRNAILWVMTLVLPLPAPARMRTGRSISMRAFCCCGFRDFWGWSIVY